LLNLAKMPDVTSIFVAIACGADRVKPFKTSFAILVTASVLVMLPATAEHAWSDGLTASQKKLMTGRLSKQFQMTKLKAEEEAARRPVLDVPASGSFRAVARAAAIRHQIPVNMFEKLVTVESNWNPNALSHAGAIGLAQLMPETARILGVNPRDPRQNLEGGARYLREQFRRFGNWRHALAAYNAGPGAVEKYGGVPPFKETQGYVRKILGK